MHRRGAFEKYLSPAGPVTLANVRSEEDYEKWWEEEMVIFKDNKRSKKW
jgi:hypothetical protein